MSGERGRGEKGREGREAEKEGYKKRDTQAYIQAHIQAHAHDRTHSRCPRTPTYASTAHTLGGLEPSILLKNLGVVGYSMSRPYFCMMSFLILLVTSCIETIRKALQGGTCLGHSFA